jgi:Tfp pilus assembly protein PilF
MGDVWIQVMTRSEGDRRRLVQDFRRKAAAEDIVGYETQLAVSPANAPLHDDVALLYLELEQPLKAAEHFSAAVQLRPKSAAALSNLGTALEAAGRPNEAAARYAEAVALDPLYAPARVNLGNIGMVQGRIDDAAAQFREAIRLQPENAEAHNNLGRLLFAQGRQRDAIAQLTEALRLRPAYVAAHFNLAQALLRNDDGAGAVSHLRGALQLRPDWPPALIALSWVLSSHADAAIRMPGESVRLAEQAASLTSRRDFGALDALAAAYARVGRFDEAISAATLAADLAARAGAADQAAYIQNRLALYRQRRPYVER